MLKRAAVAEGSPSCARSFESGCPNVCHACILFVLGDCDDDDDDQRRRTMNDDDDDHAELAQTTTTMTMMMAMMNDEPEAKVLDRPCQR